MRLQRVRHDWATSLLGDLYIPYSEKQWSIGSLHSQTCWDLLYDCIMHFDKCSIYTGKFCILSSKLVNCVVQSFCIFSDIFFCLPELPFTERYVLKLPNLVMISQFLIIVLWIFTAYILVFISELFYILAELNFLSLHTDVHIDNSDFYSLFFKGNSW